MSKQCEVSWYTDSYHREKLISPSNVEKISIQDRDKIRCPMCGAITFSLIDADEFQSCDHFLFLLHREGILDFNPKFEFDLKLVEAVLKKDNVEKIAEILADKVPSGLLVKTYSYDETYYIPESVA
jgi:hypothetical protein